MGKVTEAVHDVCRLALVVAACWALFVLVPPAAGVLTNASGLLWSASQLTGTLNAQAKANAADVRAAIHSASVIAARTEDTAADVHGITASLNVMAYKASQPETKGQKIIGGLKIGALLLSKFVPF